MMLLIPLVFYFFLLRIATQLEERRDNILVKIKRKFMNLFLKKNQHETHTASLAQKIYAWNHMNQALRCRLVTWL
jgi:hypothetical protein